MPPKSSVVNSTSSISTEKMAQLTQQITELTQQTAELKLNSENMERERDFYFNKLREIEIFLQKDSNETDLSKELLIGKILSVLYNTE